MTVTDIGIKAKSKLEVYRVLKTDGGVYVLPIKEWNYQYIRYIVTGKKLVRLSNVLYLVHQKKSNVMCYNPLLQRTIYKRNMRVDRIKKNYLPEVKGEIKFPNRSWICNVGMSHSLIKMFSKYIEKSRFY